MTQDQQNQIANDIYNYAMQGNDVNPGVPANIAQFMAAQSAHETTGFTSNFCVNYNNYFGYECVPGAKWQNGCSSGNADNGKKVGSYDSAYESTQEIVDWIYRRIKEGKFPHDLESIQTSDEYTQLLKNADYYGDSFSNYSKDVKKWLNKFVDFFLVR